MTGAKVPRLPGRVTSWDLPVSLSGFRALWRLVAGSSPLPTPLAVDPPGGALPIVTTAEHAGAVTAELHRGRYLIGGRASSDAERLIQVLTQPHKEVDAKVYIRGEQVRCLAAGREGARAVLVEIRDQVVTLSELDTQSPAIAALTVLPSMRPGQLHLNLPTSSLERAITEFDDADPITEWDRFAAALERDLSRADAADLYRIARYDGLVHATFGATSGARPRVRAPHTVVVRSSHELGSFVISRSGRSTVVEPAEFDTLRRRIEALLLAAGTRRRAETTKGVL